MVSAFGSRSFTLSAVLVFVALSLVVPGPIFAAGFAVELDARREDAVDLGPVAGFTRTGDWAVVGRLKVPGDVRSGYHLCRGKAWADRPGDFFVDFEANTTSAQLWTDRWVDLNVAQGLGDGEWHSWAFQYRREGGVLEFWLDGDLAAERRGVPPTDDGANANHLILGGQDVGPELGQGRLYLEQSSTIAHLALFSRSLSGGEIRAYAGGLAPGSSGLLLSLDVTASSVRDSRTPDRVITLLGSPRFVAGPATVTAPRPVATPTCPRCAADPGFITTTTVVTEKVPCPACDGAGASSCPACKGNGKLGTRPCIMCKGAGERTCVLCRGLGGRVQPVRKELRLPCPTCGGAAASAAVTPPAPTPTSPPPTDPRALELARQALAALNEGRLDESVGLYRQVRELVPDNHVFAHDAGVALYRLAQRSAAEAEACYRAAMAANPDYYRAYESLGCLLAGQGDLPGAVGMLNQAVALAPEVASIWFNLGHCWLFRFQGTGDRADLEKALLYSDRALALDPTERTRSENETIRSLLGK